MPIRRDVLLLAGLMLSRTAFAASGTHRTVVKGELQGFTLGPWTAFIAPFNKGALINGVDYEQTIAIDPGAFPKDVLLSCRFPATRSKQGIYGYNSLQFGNYYNTIPARPIPASQIRKIRALALDFDLQLTLGETNANANIQIDGFLTSTRNPNDIVAEYQIFLHTPVFTKDYMHTLLSLGTYTSPRSDRFPEIVWRVFREPKNAQNAPDYLFYPADGSDVLSGRFDLKHALDWLTEPNPTTGTRYLTGNEYFNGTSLGMEPIHGAVALLVKDIGCTYAAA